MRIDLYGVCVHSFIINFATNLEPLMFDLLPNSHLKKKKTWKDSTAKDGHEQAKIDCIWLAEEEKKNAGA